GAGSQAFDEVPFREAPLWIARVGLSVVEDAEVDRVDAELLGHLVHRHLKRHKSGRLAWRPHVVALGKVESCKLHLEVAVAHPINEPRGRDRRFGKGAWQVAVEAVVAESRQSAVRGRPEADTLYCPRAARAVVHDQRTLKRNLDRPPDRLRSERGEQDVGPRQELTAEATADEWSFEAYVLLSDAEPLGHVRAVPAN